MKHPYFGLLVSAVVQRDTNLSKRPGSIALFRSCEVRWSNVSSPPAEGRRLFRAVIHPDLDLSPLGLSAQGRAPSRPRRDQNNVSTAPGSMGRPSHGMDGTHLVTCPSWGHSTPSDSWRGRKRFQWTWIISPGKRSRRRPSNHTCVVLANPQSKIDRRTVSLIRTPVSDRRPPVAASYNRPPYST